MGRSRPGRHGRVAGRSTPATTALDRAGIAYRLHPYEHDPRAPSYGAEAADALGVAPERVFKTLVADVAGALAVGVVPVSGQLDLRALAASLRRPGQGAKKARLAEVAAAERATGYVHGGISPIGHRSPLPVVVDETAVLFDTVYCSAGRRGLQLELAPDALVTAAAAILAPIAAE